MLLAQPASILRNSSLELLFSFIRQSPCGTPAQLDDLSLILLSVFVRLCRHELHLQ